MLKITDTYIPMNKHKQWCRVRK